MKKNNKKDMVNRIQELINREQEFINEVEGAQNPQVKKLINKAEGAIDALEEILFFAQKRKK